MFYNSRSLDVLQAGYSYFKRFFHIKKFMRSPDWNGVYIPFPSLEYKAVSISFFKMWS